MLNLQDPQESPAGDVCFYVSPLRKRVRVPLLALRSAPRPELGPVLGPESRKQMPGQVLACGPKRASGFPGCLLPQPPVTP